MVAATTMENLVIHLPWIPEGTWFPDEVAFAGQTPTLLKTVCHKNDNPEDSRIFYVPCLKGDAAMEAKRFRASIIQGSAHVRELGDRFAPGTKGSLCGVDLVTRASLSALDVVAQMYDGESIVTYSFHLGDCLLPHAKHIRSKIEGYLSNPAIYREFLAKRAWLTELMKTDGVYLEQNFGPALALACFERNKWNRPLDMPHLSRCVAMARNNAWRRADSNICFSRTGVLINGQHRLHIIICTGVSIRQSFAFGHEDLDVETMDKNKVRSAGEQLTIQQRRQEEEGTDPAFSRLDLRGLPKGKELEQIGTAFAFIETGKTTFKTSALIDKVIETYRDDLIWLQGVLKGVGSKSKVDTSLIFSPYVRSCFLAAHNREPEKISDFLDRMLRNDCLEPNTPEHTLHKYLLEYKTESRTKRKASSALARKKDQQYSRLTVVKRTFAALVFFIEGKPLTWKQLMHISNDAHLKTFQLPLASDDPLRKQHHTTSFIPGYNWYSERTLLYPGSLG